MKFKEFSKSLIEDFYHLNDEIFYIFDTSYYSNEQLLELARSAKKLIQQGFIFKTSGSTGSEKFVVHSYDAIKTSCLSVNDWVNVKENEISLSPISMNHMGGFSVLARSIFARQSGFRAMEAWDINEFYKEVEENNVNIVSLVPSQIYEIIQLRIKCPKYLRVAFVGGSELKDEIYFEALKLGWPLLRTFGSSECASQVFTESLGVQDRTKSKPELLSHWIAELEDKSSRLILSGPSLFKGYLYLRGSGVEVSKINLDESQGYKTEDVVDIRDRKLVEFKGRVNDFIKVSATLVNMKKLRDEFTQLLNSTGLDSNKIFFSELQDLKSQNQIVVFFTLAYFEILPMIEEWNQQQPAAHRIKSVYCVDEIPRSEIGKIKSRALKDIFMSLESSKI